MMESWISRVEEASLRNLAAQRPALVLTGARQTGKTSLARRVFPNHGYVSLDLPSEAEQAEHDPGAFLLRHPLPLIIDEVQYAPGLFRHLKSVIDADRKAHGRLILTGSQRFNLMRSVSDSLAGRVAIVELEGLAHAELRKSGRAPESPVRLAVRGAMPELWENPELDAAGFHQSYVATYLERDLRMLLDVGSLRDFERFLRACALRSAQVLNKAELARDVGISPSTAGAWLSALEASNQVRLLEPWFSNRTKSLVKSPKLYLCDSGLLCYLIGVRGEEDLYGSPLAGAVWETFVFSELRKKVRWEGRGELFYWRDRTKEADFLIHRAGRFDLLDAKWSENPDAREAAALGKVAAELPPGSVKRKALVARTPNAYPLRDKVEVVPVEEA
jgi:predicted AAA+ superfamily ATPase